jgi:hypothetical protein
VLRAVGIGIHTDANTVWIATGLHAALHTNAYYQGVNRAVGAAERFGRGGVLYVLGRIKAALSSASARITSAL